mgnify:CR=1 FL=1
MRLRNVYGISSMRCILVDVVTGAILLLTFFQTLPLVRIPAQTFPPSMLVALVALPTFHARGRLLRSTALSVLAVFTSWTLLVSLIWIFLDLHSSADWSIRYIALVRQGGGLVLGISTFLAARAIATHVPPNRLIRLMV